MEESTLSGVANNPGFIPVGSFRFFDPPWHKRRESPGWRVSPDLRTIALLTKNSEDDLGRLAEESPPVVKLTTSFVKVPGHLHRAIAHPISPHWDNAVEAVERGEHRTHYMMHVFKAGDKCRVVFLESDDHAKAKAETEDFLLPGWYYEPLKVLSFHVYLNVLFCRSKRLLPRDGVALVIAQCRSEVITGLVDELRSLGNLAALDSVHLRTLHVWLTEEFLNDLTPDGSKKQYPSCHTPKYRTLLQKAGWFNCDLSDAGEWSAYLT